MAWDVAFGSDLAELARAPAARQPATLGEVWSAEWEAAGLQTTFGLQRPLDEATDELEAAFGRVAGRSVAEAAAGYGRVPDRITPRGRAALVGELAGDLAPEQQEALRPYLDVDAAARRKAAEIEKRSAETAERTYGLGGLALGFAAGAARQAVDPLNLAVTIATAPLSGGLGGAVLPFLAREAAIGAGTQAVQEPFIQAGRAELGLESGWGAAAKNVAGAAVGSAGLAGLLRGGAAGYRRLTAAGRELPGAAGEIGPADLDAAARTVERDVALDRAAYQVTDGARLDSARLTDQAEGALEAGRLGDAEPRPAPPTGREAIVRIGERQAQHRVTAADGTSVEVMPVVMEARDLLTSDDAGYLPALQPRDRDRAAATAQVREISARLDPERLGYAPEADRGAPIVGPDRMVESGNGRVMAIRLAYEAGGERAAAYRDWLSRQGVDVSGFDQPVLVRRRMTPLDTAGRAAFALQANKPATLALSAPERAAADARMLSPTLLDLVREPGNLANPANRDFLRGFVSGLPQSEQGAIATATGTLSAEGLARIRNALLARAYGDTRVLVRIAEETGDDIRAITGALTRAAPEIARLRAAIEAGEVRAEMDLIPQLVEAVERTADLRARGETLEGRLAQLDAFDTLDPAVEGWMRLFASPDGRRAASPDRIARGLAAYVAEARKSSAAPGLDLGVAPARAGDLQSLALRRAGEEGEVPAGTGSAGPGSAPEGTILFGAGRPATPADAASILPAAAATPAERLRGWKADSPFTTVEALYVDAAARQEELARFGAEIAAETGATFKNPGIKEQATSAEKLVRKRYRDARELTDANRAGFVTATPGQADAVVAGLAARLDVIDEGWAVTPTGYADRKVLVRFADGAVGEIQIWEPTLLEAKGKGGGHALYTEARSLPADDPRVAELEARQLDVYSAAAAKLGDDWKAALGSGGSGPNSASNASGVRTAAVSPSSAELTLSQPPPSSAQASPARQTAGRPSQDTSFAPSTMADTSTPNVGARPSTGNEGLARLPGDPAEAARLARRAEVEAALARAGDVDVHLDDGRVVPARQLLDEAEHGQVAAAELSDCIIKGGAK